jgi:uncharacterized membrane protein
MPLGSERILETRQIAVLSVLSALCIGVQLTPRPPNVEFTSLFCFLTGFLFGSPFGILLGALTMFINGFLSPWGLAGLNMPFQMAGMAIIGFAGGVYRKTLQSERFSVIHFVELPVMAAFLTLLYNLITNFGFAVIAGIDLIFALVMGVWFTVIHVVWNTFLFTAAFIPMVEAIRKVWS